LHYPYGCVEQASSSLLPWVLLRDLPSLAPMIPCSPEYREQAIRAGVARLLSMQTPSGGLGYWPGAKEPMFWGSAYAGLVLALAERQGIEAPQAEFGRLMDYLSSQLRSAGTRLSGVADAPLALYALSVAGRAEPAYHELLFSQRARLSPEDRALVALAVAENQGPPTMMRELLSTNRVARDYDDQRFDCSAREQSLRLLAWTRHQPADPKVEELARDLMRDQTQAHWGTTQGDAWALLALTEYARRVEGAPEPVVGQLRWGAQTLPFALTAQTNIYRIDKRPGRRVGEARPPDPIGLAGLDEFNGELNHRAAVRGNRRASREDDGAGAPLPFGRPGFVVQFKADQDLAGLRGLVLNDGAGDLAISHVGEPGEGRLDHQRFGHLESGAGGAEGPGGGVRHGHEPPPPPR